MKYIVDRIEGEFAVCEDENKEMHNIALDILPAGTKEGDTLEHENESYTKLSEDIKRKNSIKKLMDNLWQ
jgi:hypothetical protein